MNDENNPQAGGATSSSQTDDSATPTVTNKKLAVPTQFSTGAGFVSDLKIPPHNLKFDEQLFLKLLAASISLSKEEKLDIVNRIPILSQEQIDALIQIFQEEQAKLAALDEKGQGELGKLRNRQDQEWKQLEREAKEKEQKQVENDSLAKLREDLKTA